MCTNLITIKNPKLFSKTSVFDPLKDPEYLHVPCGHCKQCLDLKRYEYETRCYYQYIETRCKGGFTMFESLTYSPEFVPTFEGLKVFDSRDVNLFMKNLRIDLSRHGYQVENNLKYYLVSEYGGKTFRPHYHVLFFCSIPGVDEVTLDEFVRRNWYKGFTDNRIPSDKVVDSISAIKYVSKYVNKDSEMIKAINRQKDSAFVCHFKNLYYNVFKRKFADDREITYENLRELFGDNADFRAALPFHRQSRGLGAFIMNYFTLDELLNCSLPIPDHQTGLSFLPIPKYIVRKLFYNYDKDTKLYRPNALGIDFKYRKFLKDHESNFLTLNNLMQNAHNILPLAVQSKVLDDYNFNAGTNFSSFTSLHSHCKDIVSSRPFERFVNYALFYRDRRIGSHISITDDVDDVARLYAAANIPDADPFISYRYYENLQVVQNYNSHYSFEGYEEVLRFIQYVNKHLGSSKLRYDKLKEEQNAINKLAISLFNVS